jgi:hypothetical protein
MNILALAKARAARRRGQAGAVMFLVTMVLAVLASVGIYALAATTTEIATSGSERQAVQTHYLAEYGVVAGLRIIAPDQNQQYFAFMDKESQAGQTEGCLSMPNVSATTVPDFKKRACMRLNAAKIGSIDNGYTPFVAYAGSTPMATGPILAGGSLGPTLTVPDFAVEFSGRRRTGDVLPGNSGNFCTVEVTVSSYGQTTPTSSTYSQGVEALRARATTLTSGDPCQ